jgi:hypothetical protein
MLNRIQINPMKCLIPLGWRSEHPESAAVCAFLGDMPQQQDNSGFKSKMPASDVIKDVERDGLQFDIDVFGRYHFIALAMRREMLAKATKTEREDYAKTWGINPDLPDIIFQPPLSKISPELDIIMSRPGDPAHSEYQVCTNKEINTGRVFTIAGGISKRSYQSQYCI